MEKRGGRSRGRVMLAFLACATVATGCYTVRLDPIPPVASGEPLPLTATVASDTATATRVIQSGMAGYANTWTIEIGDAVVEYAAAYLTPVFPPGDDVTVRVDLVAYAVEGFAATTDLQFVVSDTARVLFDRSYRCIGDGYAARVVFGGAFAMKSAMRRTTDESLRSCFEQFLLDARAEEPRWRREVAEARQNPPSAGSATPAAAEPAP